MHNNNHNTGVIDTCMRSYHALSKSPSRVWKAAFDVVQSSNWSQMEI